MTTLVSTAFADTVNLDLEYVPTFGSRILIVDDEPLVRALMLTILEREGYIAEAACDTQEAIDLLQEQTFDLVLLDLCMPGPIDGEGLLFILRDRGEDVPIIVVSGWVDPESRTPEWVKAVFKKPIRMDILLSQVRSALQPA